MTHATRAADLVSVGSIVETYDGEFGFPKTYIVLAIDRTWPDAPFTLRRIDDKSGYEYRSSDLGAGWAFVSA